MYCGQIANPSPTPSPHTTRPANRGLLSFTFKLNVSAFYGIGGTFRGSSGGVYEVSEGIREY